MQVAKNLTLNRRVKEQDIKGERVPIKDKLCPSCKVRFMGDRIAFAYDMSVGNRSFTSFWCSWEGREVE